jgi:hypothetical protein
MNNPNTLAQNKVPDNKYFHNNALKITVYWDVTLGSLVGLCQAFIGTYSQYQWGKLTVLNKC